MSSFSMAHWIILAVIVFALYRAMKSLAAAGQWALSKAGGGEQKHCMTCGTDAPTRTQTRGSIWMEIVLWLAFIVPGLIYSIWRLTTRREVCAACGSASVVPYNAPAAVSHRKALAAP